MFWLMCIGLAAAWTLVKFGVLSSTVGILSLALKLALMVLVCCLVAGGVHLLRRAADRRAGSRAP